MRIEGTYKKCQGVCQGPIHKRCYDWRSKQCKKCVSSSVAAAVLSQRRRRRPTSPLAIADIGLSHVAPDLSTLVNDVTHPAAADSDDYYSSSDEEAEQQLNAEAMTYILKMYGITNKSMADLCREAEKRRVYPWQQEGGIIPGLASLHDLLPASLGLTNISSDGGNRLKIYRKRLRDGCWQVTNRYNTIGLQTTQFYPGDVIITRQLSSVAASSSAATTDDVVYTTISKLIVALYNNEDPLLNMIERRAMMNNILFIMTN